MEFLNNSTFHNRTKWGFPAESEGWELCEESLPDSRDINVSEELFSIGNGKIGVRGYPEESSLNINSTVYRNAELNQSMGTTFYSGSPDKKQQHQHQSTNMAVETEDHHDPTRGPLERERHTFSTSNELSASLSADQSNPRGSIRGCYVAGFTEMCIPADCCYPYSDPHISNESYLVRTPDPFCVDVIIGGEHVSSATGRIASHMRCLNMRTGELYRRMVWESRTSNKEVTIESTRFISANKNIAALRFSVSARNANQSEIRIISRTAIPSDPKTRASCGIESVSVGHNIAEASSVVLVRTHRSCLHLAVATTESCCSFAQPPKSSLKQPHQDKGLLGGETPKHSFKSNSASQANTSLSALPTGTGLAASIPSTTILTPKCAETETGTETIFFSCIPEQVTFELTKYIGFIVEEDAPHEDLCEFVLQRTQEAACEGYDKLFQEHCGVMESFWKNADVVYKGDMTIQGAFHFNILQVSMSQSMSTMFHFPPRSLTGEQMSGGHQWDVDAIIIPFFSHTCPEKARSLLQFRINTLYQAKATARGADLPRGALYSLRSIHGLSNPCHAYYPFLNAVISYATQQYVRATKDLSLLNNGGAEVVLASALVWLEWGVWEKGSFHIRTVLGADAYSGIVSDNLFTNIMAQEQMQWAVKIAEHFRETWPERWKEILEHCQATEEDIVAMEQAAAKMVILYDAGKRIHLVDDTFSTKKKWTFCNLQERDDKGPLIDRFHPYIIYRHQVCQVPDVLLANVLLPNRFSPDEVRENFEMYETITPPDTALQVFIKGVLAARLRLPDKAMSYFQQALLLDLDNHMGDTGSGLHCSNMAGSWWILAMGFAGMKVTQETLHLDPRLPEGCQGYEIKVRHAGCLVQVVVKPRIVTYTLLDAPTDAKGLFLVHGDSRRVHLSKGDPQKVRLQHQVCIFDFDCVIFDMDSILVGVQDVHYAAWKEALEEYFRDTTIPDFSLTKELFLAYLRHNRPVNGLAELFKRFNRPLPPSGGQTNSESAQILGDLFTRKLKKFRQIIQKKNLQFREGTFHLLSNLRANGIMVGGVTDSRNGRWILNESPQLQALFDHFIDGVDGDNLGWCYRPEMDYFKFCAKSMDCTCARTVIVMDSADGYSKSCVEQFCMLIDVSENQEPQQFRIPCVNVNNFKDMTTELLNGYIGDDTLHSRRENRRIGKNSL